MSVSPSVRRPHPTVEAELALLLASTLERRRANHERLEALSRSASEDLLLATLNRHRLSQIAISRLHELGASKLAQGLAARLAPRQRLTRMRSLTQEVLTHSLLAALEEQRVPAVPLKGATLAHRLYGDAAMREANDIDLLVSPEHLEAAIAVIRERFGYSSPSDVLTRDGRPLLHFSLTHPQGSSRVDLHWRVHWYESRSGAVMMRRTITEDGVRRLALCDDLACLLLFYARDGFVGIAPLATIAAWWDRYGVQLPPAGLRNLAAEFPELTPALTVAAHLASELVGAPLAPEMSLPWQSLRSRCHRASRLANWQLAARDEQIRAEVALVDLLLAPAGTKWQFLRRQVLIPREELVRRLPELPRKSPRLAVAQARHAIATTGRFGIALGVTRAGRSRCALPVGDAR